jgi:hypothetical protein
MNFFKFALFCAFLVAMPFPAQAFWPFDNEVDDMIDAGKDCMRCTGRHVDSCTRSRPYDVTACIDAMCSRHCYRFRISVEKCFNAGYGDECNEAYMQLMK